MTHTVNVCFFCQSSCLQFACTLLEGKEREYTLSLCVSQHAYILKQKLPDFAYILKQNLSNFAYILKQKSTLNSLSSPYLQYTINI